MSVYDLCVQENTSLGLLIDEFVGWRTVFVILTVFF